MVEILRILLGVLVVASFATIAVYALVSVGVAAATVLGSVRRKRLADELDQFLTELLGPLTPEKLVPPSRSRPARHR